MTEAGHSQLHQPLLRFPLRPLTHWFADAQNGITDFFARRGIFEELCVKDADRQTCLTRAQVDAVLSASAAAGAQSVGLEAPAGSSAPVEASGDTATTTTPATEEEAAGARGDMGDTQAPAVSAQEEDVDDDDGAEVETGSSGSADPSQSAETLSPSPTDAANDNQPADPLPATGTE